MTRRAVAPFAAVALAAVALAAGDAAALPRYSARYEQNCNLCHENPTGGGIRSTYASQFLIPGEMSVKKYSEEEMGKIAPQVSDAITIGFDYRTQFHWEHDRLPVPVFETSYRNFLQMEGNAYLSVQLDPQFSAHVTRGMTSTSEIYGLGYILPANGYVKVGRFLPAYGWKFDDHTAFVRSRLGFQPPANTDVGFEVGVHPGRFQLVGSVLNGNPGSTLDNNRARAYDGMAFYRGHVGRVGVGIGGSAMRNLTGAGETVNAGPMGYLKAGRFTWLGEADWSRFDPSSTGANTTEFITSHELCWTATRGVDLLATYDFYDPDVDLKSGARIRYGLGTEITPRPFLSIHAMVTTYRPDVGPALAPLSIETKNFSQAELQFHLFY